MLLLPDAGAIAVSALLSEIEFLKGEENLTLYQFNTRSAKHYFCKSCGIYTHHQRRSDPSVYGVNVACLNGISPFDFQEVKVMDGISHPADFDGTAKIAGILRYSPTE